MRNGRYFTDMDEDTLAALMEPFPHFSLLKKWISKDVRPDKKCSWLNVIYRHDVA